MKTLLFTIALVTAGLFAPTDAQARDRRHSDQRRGISIEWRGDRHGHHHHHRYIDPHHGNRRPLYDRYGHRVDSHGHHVDRHGHHVDRGYRRSHRHD